MLVFSFSLMAAYVAIFIWGRIQHRKIIEEIHQEIEVDMAYLESLCRGTIVKCESNKVMY